MTSNNNTYVSDTHGWAELLPPREPCAALQGKSRVAWAVIGAGLTGLACARRFSANGDRVAVTYNSSPPPDGLFGVKCDVTSADDVDAAFSAVEAHFGGTVEVLISNAEFKTGQNSSAIDIA